jgi:hypothetical protein
MGNNQVTFQCDLYANENIYKDDIIVNKAETVGDLIIALIVGTTQPQFIAEFQITIDDINISELNFESIDHKILSLDSHRAIVDIYDERTPNFTLKHREMCEKWIAFLSP